MIEQTLVIVKPDGVIRGLIGEVLKRFEQRGLKIIGIKMIHAEKNFAEQHYTEEIAQKHGKKVRDKLLAYITEGPVVAFVVEGVNAVEITRKIVGSTYPSDAPLGTIRGDYAHISKAYANASNNDVRNIVHASGSSAEATLEISLWFSGDELFKYKTVLDEQIL